MTMPPIRVITFDLDDTLWDVRPVLIEAERRMQLWLKEHAPAARALLADGGAQTIRNALLADQPALAHQISRLRITVLQSAMRQAGHTPARADQLAQRAFAVFLAARNEITVFDGVAALLRSLAQHYRLGALSNGNADLRRLDVGEHFDFHFSAENVGAAKPDPALFHAALQHAQVSPDEVLHVGDSVEHDVAGAARAGIRSVWINPHGLPLPAASPPPTAQVRTVLELPGVLQQLHDHSFKHS